MDYERFLLRALIILSFQKVYWLKKLATDEDAPAQAQTPSRPSRTITTSIEVVGAFVTNVLRQVHDVAFALVSRWPPCTVYPRASQEGLTWPVWCKASRISSLCDSALADILATPSSTSQRSHRLAVVTRPPGYGYLVLADARLVYALSD